MNLDKHSTQIIRDDESHWFTTLFLILTVLVIGLSMKVHWTLPAWWHKPHFSARFAQQPRVSVAPSSLGLAYSYVHVRDWKNALAAAQLTIQSEPDRAEAYHIAGAAAGQVYGVHSIQSREYYAKYVELEPDTRKTEFIKEIFPDLNQSTPPSIPQRAPASHNPNRSAWINWLVIGFYLWFRYYARGKRQTTQAKHDQPKGT
jgi:hypothetical protein